MTGGRDTRQRQTQPAAETAYTYCSMLINHSAVVHLLNNWKSP